MSKDFQFTSKDFFFLTDLVKNHTGIVLGDNKKDMVYSRLAKRLRSLKINSFSDYCALLESSEGEIGNLVNSITTNLTKFFREYHHFEFLEKILAESKPKTKIRIWSAGCSSGQEPYSIALTISKIFPDYAKRNIKILASDIDTAILQQAKNGEYDVDQLSNIPKEFHDNRIIIKDKKFTLSNNIKSLIIFNQLNLINDWPMKGKFYMIFCRNVIIYFSKETQRNLFKKFTNCLEDDGFLYLGHSENIFNTVDNLESIGKTIYKKR